MLLCAAAAAAGLHRRSIILATLRSLGYLRLPILVAASAALFTLALKAAEKGATSEGRDPSLAKPALLTKHIIAIRITVTKMMVPAPSSAMGFVTASTSKNCSTKYLPKLFRGNLFSKQRKTA